MGGGGTLLRRDFKWRFRLSQPDASMRRRLFLGHEEGWRRKRFAGCKDEAMVDLAIVDLLCRRLAGVPMAPFTGYVLNDPPQNGQLTLGK
ncbi:MAG: hypothetical protein CMM01_26275 [Rhodopirellula sp.]|nr:hypothetical protein [Rhodopirellula sp.]